MSTIIPVPQSVQKAITELLATPNAHGWMKRAQALHLRYMQQEPNKQQRHVSDALDALAYLALRAPATYAQIWGAVAAVCEIVPNWQPTSVLDLGCGPGSGLWALLDLLPSLTTATGVDQSAHFLTLGPQILKGSEASLAVTWQQADVVQSVQQTTKVYDIILLANVLNELNETQRSTLIATAFERCSSLLLIVEPGTPIGSRIVQTAAQQLAAHGTLLAPYIGNHFVPEPWLHFPQRFTRPSFTRRLRQGMRDSDLMASDWEEAKYSYVAIGKLNPESRPWARVIGPAQITKGHLEVPLLTQEQRLQVNVFKRHKQQFAFAKKLRWGELIFERTDLIAPVS